MKPWPGTTWHEADNHASSLGSPSARRMLWANNMATLRNLILSSFAVAAIGGCADSDGVIDYQLQGGFVGLNCTVHIEPDGKMTRANHEQSETLQLDDATRSDIKARVDQANFPALEPVYSCDCADDFAHIVTVDIDGGTYTVKADGTAEFPDRLRPLIDKLSQLSGCALVAF